jgi:hypothetical protein
MFEFRVARGLISRPTSPGPIPHPTRPVASVSESDLSCLADPNHSSTPDSLAPPPPVRSLTTPCPRPPRPRVRRISTPHQISSGLVVASPRPARVASSPAGNSPTGLSGWGSHPPQLLVTGRSSACSTSGGGSMRGRSSTRSSSSTPPTAPSCSSSPSSTSARGSSPSQGLPPLSFPSYFAATELKLSTCSYSTIIATSSLLAPQFRRVEQQYLGFELLSRRCSSL